MKREAFFRCRWCRADFVMFPSTTCRPAFGPRMTSETEMGPKQTVHTKMRGRKTGVVKHQVDVSTKCLDI